MSRGLTFFFNRERRKEQRERDDEAMRRRMYFDILVGLLTAITLPLVLVGTVFGMNNNDLPASTPFLDLMCDPCRPRFHSSSHHLSPKPSSAVVTMSNPTVPPARNNSNQLISDHLALVSNNTELVFSLATSLS